MKSPSADRFYHLLRLGNQAVMRPADLDHIRIWYKAMRQKGTPLPNRAIDAYCGDVAIIQRVADNLVQKGSETNRR